MLLGVPHRFGADRVVVFGALPGPGGDGVDDLAVGERIAVPVEVD